MTERLILAMGCIVFPHINGEMMSRTQLTTREKECLYLLAAGMKQKEIAIQFEVTIRTVEQQVASAKQKLAARTATQAVVEAIRSGQIDL